MSEGHRSQPPFLALCRISRRFGNIWANREVSLEVAEGEIRALIGENGAGKSTLMHILYGHLRADYGQIKLSGREVTFRHPRQALAAGIGMVHQQMLVFPQLSVLENIVVGAESSRWGILERGSMRDRIEGLCASFGFELDADARVDRLPFAQRQQIELLRLLYRGARVLIFDEPTGLLSPPEVFRFLDLLRSLRSKGHTVLFISHRLREVIEVADRISIMRRGRLLATLSGEEVSPERLGELMTAGLSEASRAPDTPDRVEGSFDFREPVPRSLVAPEIPDPVRGSGALAPASAVKVPASPVAEIPAPHSQTAVGGDATGEGRGDPAAVSRPLPVLELEALFALAGRQEEAGLQGLSLTVREGEIFGIGGVVGNGQRVLARIVAGLRPVDRGCVRFGGRDITRDSILKRIHAGIRYLPANPVEEALLPTRSLAENLLLGRHRSGRLQCGGWLRRRSVRAWADELCRRFDVVHGGLGQPLRSLSGGNQQRVALARVLAGKPRLVVMEQPGRGLDVAAQAALQQRIRALQVEGVSFLIFSFDVDELLSLCDRVGVLYRGTLAGIAGSAEVTPAVLGCWMVGLGDAHRQGGNGIGL